MKAALAPHKDLVSSPVPIVPFADWDFYYTTKPLEWRAKAGAQGTPAQVTVPAGFVTDLASIPVAFWSVLPPAARYSYPAIIHDYLYWFQPCSRAEADAVFEAAMADLLVSSAKIAIIYNAVRLEGNGAWDSNAELRQAGQRRILKKVPSKATTTWDVWKTLDVF
ncbi:DUF1353 domain-containing protein [Bradyrhizobium sp. LjRoot220]